MFKREHRYLVFKGTDIAGLSYEEQQYLFYLGGRCEQLRKFRGKTNLECVVVEHDWPEYETVWKMIEDRVNNES